MGLGGTDPGQGDKMRLLKKPASGVLIARRAQCTPMYDSPSSLLAALLDGLFEQSLFLLPF